MPELPDIDVYVESLSSRILHKTLKDIRVRNPFLVRSVEPPLSAVNGKRVVELRRIGKRIAIGFDEDYWLVLHLMVAGRLHWHDTPVLLRGKQQLAAFDFESGTLTLTEAGTKKRASLHMVRGTSALMAHDPGGIEPLTCSMPEFATRLRSENRTLKRALTNPKTFSGIGNAYSDEILHAARLSPARLTSKLNDEEVAALHGACRSVLATWRDRLRADTGKGFPEKVTAFRKDMAVHGRFGQPCPVCATPVARIRYKSRETNYCPTCQTGGKLLADRSLSRLLKDDWPDSV